MKKRMFISIVIVVALMAGSSVTALAGPEEGFAKHLEMMAAALGLSDAQKEKISAIITTERESNASVIQQIEENRQLLRAAIESTTFDETAIRTLAEKQGSLHAEMIVSRARVWSLIRAELTAEQQALADTIRPMLDRPPKPGPPGFGR